MIASGMSLIAGCSKKTDNGSGVKHQGMIVVDNQDDAPTIDPVMSRDANSARVIYDLFEGLTSFDQKNNTIAGIAESWNISPDGRVYTFHLRDKLKFSDKTPITANDVVYSWQRLADPKTGSPYSNLAFGIVNGQDIVAGKKPVAELGVTAKDSKTIVIKLTNPNPAFLQICAMPNTMVVSQANIEKFGKDWTNKANIVTSGAYTIGEWVIKGHMLLNKNNQYYDAKDVQVDKIKILPIVDQSASYNQFKTGEVDVTFSAPVDQYQQVQVDYPDQLHTVSMEALYYYDFNMIADKYKTNPQLRQALSMAVDRNALVQQILGQGQLAAYSYVTNTVENGKFANIGYSWSSWSRTNQINKAKELFAKAGYSPSNPLELTISYNTLDQHKKVALAIASMWQQVFGIASIKVITENQEWKTFIQARQKGNYDIARDGWIADYDNVGTYTDLFLCNNPLNKSKYCNPEYDKLIYTAQATANSDERVKLINQALQIAENDYAIIPLYQYTYYRLVNPRVKGYNIDGNHMDHVMSKWYKLN